MKIGILTLPLHNNYGGVMQAYALMTILKKFGHDVELIYRRQEIKKRTLKSDLKFFIKRSLKSIITRKHYPLFYNYEREYKCDGEKMVQFSNQYIIPKTNAIYTSYELESECGSRFDAIIVGSDQVWRPIFVPNIQDFFLHFVKNNYTKKIAYAASFGTSNPEYSEEQIKLCGDLLCQFDAVSSLLISESCSFEDLQNSQPIRFAYKNSSKINKVMLLLQSDLILDTIYRKTIAPSFMKKGKSITKQFAKQILGEKGLNIIKKIVR